MSKMLSERVLIDFCKAIGLDPNQWSKVTVVMESGMAVTIEAQGYAEMKNSTDLGDVVRKHKVTLQGGVLVYQDDKEVADVQS